MKTGTGIKALKFVVDASIVVKWFVQEENTPQARLILRQIVDGEVFVYAPDLLLYEVANALRKGKRLEQKALAASLETLWDCGVKFEQPDIFLLQTAISFMVEYDLTSYDAAYVALARILQTPLLTADAKAHKKIKEIEILEL